MNFYFYFLNFSLIFYKGEEEVLFLFFQFLMCFSIDWGKERGEKEAFDFDFLNFSYFIYFYR
jgi:hypothetical protein